jgi:hypothetical protein
MLVFESVDAEKAIIKVTILAAIQVKTSATNSSRARYGHAS